MKLKKLSPLELALIAAAIIIMAANAVLQMEILRYVMWAIVIAVVVLNFLLETCPNCGKRIRSNKLTCPHCGHAFIEPDEESEE